VLCKFLAGQQGPPGAIANLTTRNVRSETAESMVYILRHYGHSVIFLVVFAENLGLPVPSYPVILVDADFYGSGQFNSLTFLPQLFDRLLKKPRADVILSGAKDLALGFCVEGPNQGAMLRPPRRTQHDRYPFSTDC
jgi:hypothetical protein